LFKTNTLNFGLFYALCIGCKKSNDSFVENDDKNGAF